VDVVVVQVAAYITLTAASLVVATVSLFLAYWQHVGWAPLLLMVRNGLRTAKEESADHYTAQVQFEIWNRRRYPLIIRRIDVMFTALKFGERLKGYPYDSAWNIRGNGGYWRQEIALAPNSHAKLKFKAPFPKRTLDDLKDLVTVTVLYYDPRTNKHLSLNGHTHYLSDKEGKKAS
jgi:hypothetical protein